MNGATSQSADSSAANGHNPVARGGVVSKSKPQNHLGDTPVLNGYASPSRPQPGHANGVLTNGVGDSEDPSAPTRLDEMPLEIRQLFNDALLPLSRLIERSAQACWISLSKLVDQLSQLPLPDPPPSTDHSTLKGLQKGAPLTDQSKVNLDKKDRLLRFASDQKADFIKLLVLLQWSKDAKDVNMVLQLNYWLHTQRQLYQEAAFETALMKRRLAHHQVPYPDLTTALEVLSLQKVPSFPSLGYGPPKPLSAESMLKTLKELDGILCTRLVLDESIPSQMHDFTIHDGRVTFHVPGEFELDLTVVDDDPTSRFYFVDFRFVFSPSSTIPEGALKHDISLKASDILTHSGLQGLYQFLHDLTLSYKLTVLYKQAQDLLQSQWSSHLRVELIKRTLVVQYWTNRPGGKSWLEIGIKSGRRKDKPILNNEEPMLAIRWLRGSKLVDDVDICFDAGYLSMETILHQVLALHIAHILDPVFDALYTSPLYNSGDLLLEQTSSLSDPHGCYLELQYSKRVLSTITIEPVSGAVVLSPSNALSNRTTTELLHSKDLSLDLPSTLIRLRCLTAEQGLVKSAESADWHMSHLCKPSQAEQKTLFAKQGDVVRCVYLRQSSWKPEYLLAAVLSGQGDRWWLLQRSSLGGLDSWNAQQIESSALQAEPVLSRSYMNRLANFVSGIIVLQANAIYLTRLGIGFTLPKMPRFGKSCGLPQLSFVFDASKMPLRSLLSRETDELVDAKREPLDPRASTGLDIGAAIHRTIVVKYQGLDHTTQRAVLLAEGYTSTPRKVLARLITSKLDPAITIEPDKSRFGIVVDTSVGHPAFEDLFHKLLHLENTLACVAMALRHGRLSITSLSLSHLALRYGQHSGSNLSCTIHFNAASGNGLELSPMDLNPHVRIAPHLRKVLTGSSRCLSDNVKLLLPLLAFTQPLLSVLQEMQVSTYSNLEGVKPRVNILPRHPTMYGIQYFTPSGSSPTMQTGSEGSPRMLARLEILSCQRGKQSYWVLRPAIEEFETYTRPSFCSAALEQRLRESIFTKNDGGGGWIPLGSGAACHIVQPERLLRAVDDLITDWLRNGRHTATTGTDQQAKADLSAASKPQQQHDSQGSSNQASKATGNVTKPAQGNATSWGAKRATQGQKGQDVITID